MATRFPLILNGVKFQVNPTSLKINNNLLVGALQAQSGTIYQVWYNQPPMLTINGICAGASAYQELLFLKNNYAVTINPGKTSQLFYKTKLYNGFIASLDVSHVSSQGTHLKFSYNIAFQLLQGETFNLQDFALQPTGLLGQVLTTISGLVNEPIAGFENNINNLFGKVTG